MCPFFGALMSHRWELINGLRCCETSVRVCTAERKTSCLAILLFFCCIRATVSHGMVLGCSFWGRGGGTVHRRVTGLILTFGSNSFSRAFDNNVLLSVVQMLSQDEYFPQDGKAHVQKVALLSPGPDLW